MSSGSLPVLGQVEHLPPQRTDSCRSRTVPLRKESELGVPISSERRQDQGTQGQGGPKETPLMWRTYQELWSKNKASKRGKPLWPCGLKAVRHDNSQKQMDYECSQRDHREHLQYWNPNTGASSLFLPEDSRMWARENDISTFQVEEQECKQQKRSSWLLFRCLCLYSLSH